MKNTIFINSQNNSLESLFNYFCTSNLNTDSNYNDVLDRAESFINTHPSIKNDMNIIIGFSFYSIDLYQFPNSVSDLERLEFISSLDYFHSIVKNILVDTPAVDVIGGKLEREVSPPYNAYHYTGHNKLDINTNSSSYYFNYER